MPTVIGISGALRRGSYNAALLRGAVELAPAGLSIEVASVREIPVIDWLSRPADDIRRVFGSKPVALMGASDALHRPEAPFSWRWFSWCRGPR